jgi:hypothetical protein
MARRTLDYFNLYLTNGESIVTDRGVLPLAEPFDYPSLTSQVMLRGSAFSPSNQLQTQNLMQTLQLLITSPFSALIGDGGMMRMLKEALSMMGMQNVDDIIPQQLIYENAQKRLSLVEKMRGVFPMMRNQPPTPEQASQSQVQQQGGSGLTV